MKTDLDLVREAVRRAGLETDAELDPDRAVLELADVDYGFEHVVVGDASHGNGPAPASINNQILYSSWPTNWVSNVIYTTTFRMS